MLIDLPNFWEFVAELICQALLKVYKANNPRSVEVFKAVSKAFVEVIGSDLIKLNNSLKDLLSKAVSVVLSLVNYSYPSSYYFAISQIVQRCFVRCRAVHHLLRLSCNGVAVKLAQ